MACLISLSWTWASSTFLSGMSRFNQCFDVGALGIFLDQWIDVNSFLRWACTGVLVPSVTPDGAPILCQVRHWRRAEQLWLGGGPDDGVLLGGGFRRSMTLSQANHSRPEGIERWLSSTEWFVHFYIVSLLCSTSWLVEAFLCLELPPRDSNIF